jgi:hypothetical protein
MILSILDTYYGDADLNRKVDVVDLGFLATNWQGAGDWSMGDFTGDGIIDVADLGLLATNWQAGVAAGASLAEALAGFGLSSASVPEPVVGTFGMVLLVLRVRFRR